MKFEAISKKTKTLILPLIDGREVRIYKADVSCINEQFNIEGGIDVEVWMKSGFCYLTTLPKQILNNQIFN